MITDEQLRELVLKVGSSPYSVVLQLIDRIKSAEELLARYVEAERHARKMRSAGASHMWVTDVYDEAQEHFEKVKP